jgi:prepilin-type N-terminal cleavage/methylation domain-containing protein
MSINSRSGAGGFTLLEVMIALTIFASIAIVISGTTSQAANTLLTLENKRWRPGSPKIASPRCALVIACQKQAPPGIPSKWSTVSGLL